MATHYLLPCDCGQKLEIDTSQAGLTLTCGCGKDLEVPSLRGIRQLDVANDEPPKGPDNARPAARRAEPPADTWGPRQGTMLTGGLLMLAGLGFALVMWWTRPVYEVPNVDVNDFRRSAQTWTLEESFKYWELYKQGIDKTVDPFVMAFEYRLAVHARWRNAGLGLAVIGLALLLGGKFLSLGEARGPVE